MQSATQTVACQQSPGYFWNPLTGLVQHAPCKKWSCPACGPRAARRFIARVMRTPRFTYFITLTSKPDGVPGTSAAQVKKFNACWRSWLRWLKREAGVNHVTWTLERGSKTGHLHRHALIDTNRSFSYKRARASLVRTGHGAVCDFKPSRSQHSSRAGARYLGKYLAKHLENTPWPKYSRRCQTSTKSWKAKSSSYKFLAYGDHWRSITQDSPLDLHRMPRMLADDDPRVLHIALNQYEKLRHGGTENVQTEDTERQNRAP